MAEPTPYRLAAREYLAAGWSPIPFPERAKWPPANVPTSFTGAEGVDVTAAQVNKWCSARGRAGAGNLSFVPTNIGLRLPRSVLGIDVDAYGDKAGEATLAAAVAAWGPLPDTWRSTSRDDGASGIRFFRIPEGLAWPGKLPFGGGVELIRWDHRYAIVMPSVHPEGMTYLWVRPDDVRVADEFPTVAELPSLPESWVGGLTGGRNWTAHTGSPLDRTDVAAWIEARPGGKPCVGMAATIAATRAALREATDAGGAHEAALNGIWGVLRDARDGHRGLVTALRLLQKSFYSAVSGRRKDGEAEGEWRRAVHSGVEKVAAEEREPEEDDLCEALAAGWAEKESAEDSGSYPRTDIGNAHRLVDRHGTDLRYLPQQDVWVVWNGGGWSRDAGGVTVRRLARETVKAMEREKARYLEPKARADFVSWVRTSGSGAKLSAMISEAESWEGVTVDAAVFDSDNRTLMCANGVLELGGVDGRGVVFREATRDDYCSLSTRAEYDPGASNWMWEEFLSRFIPDKDLLSWVQRLAGYSLLGGNPLRSLVVLIGGTSTGKTTFAEAMLAALGDYAGGFNLSVFRDNQDERPRADLVEAMPKRLLIAEESSEEWNLHADQVKRLTGGGRIRGRRPHDPDYVERTPAFTPWFVTNSPPTIRGADLALYRRLYVVPFNETMPREEEIPDYRDTMCNSAKAAILRWMVDGWRMYLAEGLPADEAPMATLLAAAEFTSELSDFDVWIHACCEFGAEYAEQSTDLYQAYRAWADETGVRAESMTAFGRSLARRGYPKHRTRVGERQGDGKVWFRTGVRLNRGWATRCGIVRPEMD